MSIELEQRKIFPRNLTARAEARVLGNSISTRLESGVENCYPGLEFDQRNLDKRFFPGLVFEFHADGEAGFVRSVDPDATGESANITPDDIVAGLYVWAIFGVHGRLQDGSREYALDCTGLSGLECWRYIHDLEPGSVALLLGASRYGQAPLSARMLDQFRALAAAGQEQLSRDPADNLQIAVLCGQRRRYLDDQGVIDVEAYEPGDLTRSLCAPWQYDFRDCGCFYWASNKPDIVAVKPGSPQIANFQRAPGSADPTGAVRDYQGWVGGEYNYTQMIHQWEELKSVVDGAECSTYALTSGPVLPPGDILPKPEIIRRLRYLATVEHGLMIEYLYAHYSLRGPAVRPEHGGDDQRLFDAKRVLLSVGIDEMRHLRCVNEILRELGEPIELGRFTEFEDFDGDARTLSHTFALEPLNAARLAWFIEVEAPSTTVDIARDPGTVDGLYTRLLLSVEQGSEFSEMERQKVTHLLKLIVDEGGDHHSRFIRVRDMLSGLDEAAYLQLPSKPAPLPAGHAARMYEDVADRCYEMVLFTLQHVFETGGARIGEMLHAARYAMYALDDAAKALAAAGGAPLFTLPDEPQQPLVEAAGTHFKAKLDLPFENRVAFGIRELIDAAANVDRGLATDLQERYDKLVSEMAELE